MSPGEVVREAAARLADPERVVAVVAAPGNADEHPGGRTAPWAEAALGTGGAGLAVLFGELAGSDPAYRAVAREYLRRGATHPAVPGAGLHGDAVLGLAVAARLAGRDGQDYAGLRRALDPAVRARVPVLCAAAAEAVGTGRGVQMAHYDVISGLAGLGRLLLADREAFPGLVEDVLSVLVRLTRPIEVAGREVPGWWVAGAPSLAAADEPRYATGHLNLGLAHGAPGPLAMLALARSAGVEVPGQAEAIERLAGWLLGHRVAGGWPAFLTAADPVAEPARLAWCYGAPGVARALQLAGRALGRADWAAVAVDSLRTALRRDPAGWGVRDATLCHGWAGLLHITALVARDAGDPELAAACGPLADRLAACFDPGSALGFRFPAPPGATFPWAADRAGLLDGAAGAVLALHAYARGGLPATPWDRYLLVA